MTIFIVLLKTRQSNYFDPFFVDINCFLQVG